MPVIAAAVVPDYKQSITYVWKIVNISKRDNRDNGALQSPPFGSKDIISKSDWVLGLRFTYYKAPTLCLKLKNAYGKKISGSYTLAVLIQKHKLFEKTFKLNQKAKSIGMDLDMTHKTNKMCVPESICFDGSLTLQCELNLSFVAPSVSEEKSANNTSISRDHIRPAISLWSESIITTTPPDKVSLQCYFPDLKTKYIAQSNAANIMEYTPGAKSIKISTLVHKYICDFKMFKTRTRDVLWTKNDVLPMNRFGKTDYLPEFLYEIKSPDSFTLECILTTLSSLLTRAENIEVDLMAGSGLLSQDFASMLTCGEYSDCKIVTEDGRKELSAHVVVLAARSPVFRAMFEAPMLEASQRIVRITDFDHKTITDLVHYMYTGKAPNINETAEHLLVAAVKYNVVSLKTECEEVLCKKVYSVSDAVRMLIYSDLHNTQFLQYKILAFLKEN